MSDEDSASVYPLLLGIALGLVVGSLATGAVAGGPGELYDDVDERASVRCVPFIANGSASGICVAHGDVSIEWVESFEELDGNATNDSVRLFGIPENNSTVRRHP